jgi:hypothetical protein
MVERVSLVCVFGGKVLSKTKPNHDDGELPWKR